MVVSIHQPDYIPWIGFFYKIAHSDIFVYLDDAQYSNEAAHNYNVIKTPQGVLRLRIPVDYNFGDPILAVRTRDELKWKDKHLKTLELNYRKATFFDAIYPAYSGVVRQKYHSLADLNEAINAFICNGFQIHTPVLKSSTMDINTAREERVLDICTALNADDYLSGNGARTYQIPEHFEQRGLRLTYHDYKPIVYKQLWKEFLPCMSVLDYIFNCGFDWQYIETSVIQENWMDNT